MSHESILTAHFWCLPLCAPEYVQKIDYMSILLIKKCIFLLKHILTLKTNELPQPICIFCILQKQQKCIFNAQITKINHHLSSSRVKKNNLQYVPHGVKIITELSEYIWPVVFSSSIWFQKHSQVSSTAFSTGENFPYLAELFRHSDKSVSEVLLVSI